MTQNNPPADSLFDRVSKMADEIGLEGDAKAGYVDDHMIKAGYERRPNYVKPDAKPEDGDKGGNVFSGNWFGKQNAG